MKSLNSASIKSSVFLLIVSLNLMLSCSNEKPETKINNDLDKDGLKGKVKILNETEFSAEHKFGQIQKGKIQKKDIYFFNTNGNITSQKNYESDGSLSMRIITNYNENGSLNEMVIYHNDGTVSSRKVFKYNEVGKLIEDLYLDSHDSLFSKSNYKSDVKGNIIEEKNYFKGTFRYQKLYKYDNRGNKIEEIAIEPNGNMSTKTTFFYNEEGNLIIENYQNLSFNWERKRSYKYDNNRNLIEEISIFKDKTFKAIYRYDNYDQYNNWLLNTKEGKRSSEDATITITEREIEYY